MIIHNCEQGTPEWFQLRSGIITASCMEQVMAKGKTLGAKSLTREKYMRQLAGEIITGEPGESYSNAHMERGHVMEDEARSFYCLKHDVDAVRIGFVTNIWDGFTVGYSPDSFIGESGALEIKTKLPHLMIECYERDRSEIPPEHRHQIQAGIEIAERDWIDLECYWPKMPEYRFRAFRDEPYIANMRAAARQFNEELYTLVDRIRRYGAPSKRAA